MIRHLYMLLKPRNVFFSLPYFLTVYFLIPLMRFVRLLLFKKDQTNTKCYVYFRTDSIFGELENEARGGGDSQLLLEDSLLIWWAKHSWSQSSSIWVSMCLLLYFPLNMKYNSDGSTIHHIICFSQEGHETSVAQLTTLDLLLFRPSLLYSEASKMDKALDLCSKSLSGQLAMMLYWH